MKKKVMLLLCIGIFTLTGCGKVPKLKNGEELLISVDETKISAMDFYTQLKDKYGKDLLIEIVDKLILEEKYKENDELTKYVSEQIDSIKQQYGGDEAFAAALKQYSTTEKELSGQIALDYRRNLAINDYIKSNLTNDEINNYYKDSIRGDIKASHILIKSDAKEDATDEEKEKADKKAKQKAEEVIKKLNDGAKFADLAKEYSSDGTKDNGGDLGWFGKGQMVDAFETAVVALKKNEYTKEPVKSEFGYHVILKTGTKKKPALKNVKDEIKDKLVTEKLNADASLKYKALEKIRKEAGLKIEDDSLKSNYNKYIDNLISNAANSNNTTN